MQKTTIILHVLSLGLYGLSALSGFTAILTRRFGRNPAIFLAVGGLLSQLILLGARWKAGGHLPVTGLFETQHFLALWVTGAAVYFYRRYRAETFLPLAMTFSFLALLLAGRGPVAVMPLTPAIDTPLFLIHVATSFAAYGLFGVAALMAVYRIAGWPASPMGGERRMMDEGIYLGYILFTWCMIAGSLWAYLAWGSYWTWRIKGLWSWILWFYYAGLLHIRARPGWQGWPLNAITLGGFALVLFTYLGLGILFSTSHPLLPGN